MASLKIGAHPLVVAVAMGLLGPGALTELEDRRKDSAEARVEQALEADAPTAEEFARMEALFNEAREQ